MKCNWEKIKSYSWLLHVHIHTHTPLEKNVSMAKEHGLNCSIVTRPCLI